MEQSLAIVSHLQTHWNGAGCFVASKHRQGGQPVFSSNVEILSCSLEHEDKSTANTKPEYHMGSELGGSAHYLCLES